MASVIWTASAWARAEQADEGVVQATWLLRDATQPQTDSSHNVMLLGLRELADPALKPLFQALKSSPYLSMRIHGQLGSAALSPDRRIDLASLAEIDEPRELVQLLSAAMDDGLIDEDAMATLMTWPGLDLPLRQAIGLRLIGLGGKVDPSIFKPSMAIDIADHSLAVSKLLQHALAALMLAESGDADGNRALEKIGEQNDDRGEAVVAQLLDAAMRYGFRSAGPLAISVANDKQRPNALRLLAIQSALRLKTPGSTQAWQSLYQSQTDSAQRTRLAMIALDSAANLDPKFFDSFAHSGVWIDHIASAGKALASRSKTLADAWQPLIATGQPLSVQWVVTYCQREKPVQGPSLLMAVIQHYDAGPPHHRAKINQAAIDAATALCELYPHEAQTQLVQVLHDSVRQDAERTLGQRQVILMGIARAKGRLTELASHIEPDGCNDFTTEALRLFIRARHGAALTESEWQRVSDIVQGVGQFDPAMKLQLAWAYLKHRGQADHAIRTALRPLR